MEKVNKTTSCFTVDRYLLSKIKDDEAYKEYIINELSNNLARNLVDILSSEGEVIVSMSDVRCHENDDFATVDYRQYLKWSHLVRCKDCVHGIPTRIDTVTGEFSDELYCYRHHMCHFEDYYCADGDRKEGGVDGQG